MQYSRRFQTRAFTIIELLVVILIIGLLTSVATINYVTAQRHSRDHARKAQTYSIATAVEAYYSVNSSFPGKISSSTQSAAALANCEQTDTTPDTNNGNQYDYYYYYFAPLSPTAPAGNPNLTACDNRTAAGYDKTLYSPYPSWIPGIGPFLNPTPIDKQYQGADGTQTGAYSEVMLASDSSVSNQTRTYVYRHLVGGYVIYTRLESGGDPDAAPFATGNPITDTPTLPSQIQTPNRNGNIFMVRK